MKREREYRVVGTATISVSTVVVAMSKKQAIKSARERPMIGLCYQCARGDADEEWVTSGELDGEPENLKVENVSA